MGIENPTREIEVAPIEPIPVYVPDDPTPTHEPTPIEPDKVPV